MVKQVTAGIAISVETFYQPEYSNPMNNEYMFAYRIIIENNNHFPIKLLKRHWHIVDSNNIRREIEGEGVVDMQPVVSPGEEYRYVSGANLRTEIGKMYGIYLMENQHNKKQFEVPIPEFDMIVPFKMN